ncbi:methylenetetrahydrofolate reductase-domain-containing protein [Globomyces pollinis-pini]|nr:methylenetetrahydrofolate reductase-domain-containing protein [Globomyces pollinis-pini]
MKISDKIKKAEAEQRPYWSFEYFPPKTETGVMNLYDRMERMYALGPEFIDVTWNAGGTSSDTTMEICTTAQSVYGLETCMHLTCTNMPREKIDIALKEAKAAGVQNILALRGDPPRGQENWTSVDTGFSYSTDLVKYIRKEYGDYFCIGVAGYPEGHPDSETKSNDLLFLKEKVDAGADYIVTQLFYDCDLYLEWVKEVRALGIDTPILPGMMIIQSYGGFKRMTSLCKTTVPKYIYDDLEPIKDDDQAVKDYGVNMMIDMISKLREGGVLGFHFYTLNLERSTRLILEGCGFLPQQEVVKPLPWSPSLAVNRSKENVRPIFWRNRPKSYIARTQNWDEFPNGRWGDSRSPAFGDLDGYGINLKYPADQCLQLWNKPTSVRDVSDIFVDYINGKVSCLPWCDSPLQGESEIIKERLSTLNKNGFLTINSQPAVDGALSSDKTFGWGPKNGFVYQKAYLEFFVSAQALDLLLDRVSQYPYITFYAINREGDLRTNTKGDTPNAVTWGVFPGQEIVQPTVVDGQAFNAWKDEAFELWRQWSSLYEAESSSKSLLTGIYDNWFLVNIVDNNYKSRFAIFDLLDDVKAELTGEVLH